MTKEKKTYGIRLLLVKEQITKEFHEKCKSFYDAFLEAKCYQRVYKNQFNTETEITDIYRVNE